MHSDAKISSDAQRWFFGAGLAAVLLSILLAMVDYRLSHSKGEQVLGSTLRELRTAQSSLPSRVTDTRQGSGVVGFSAPVLPDSATVSGR
jgi:hypothetical protein